MDDQLKQALSEIPDKWQRRISAVAYAALYSGRPMDEVLYKTRELASMLRAAEEVETENDK